MVAHAKFPAKILTPDGEVFNGDVEMVSTRTTLGLIGILARHAPLLASLEPTELKIYKTENDIDRYAASEGYLQVGGNQALLLLEEAVPIDKLDTAALRERLAEADRAVAASAEGSEARRGALRDKKRLEVFISLAK